MDTLEFRVPKQKNVVAVYMHYKVISIHFRFLSLLNLSLRVFGNEVIRAEINNYFQSMLEREMTNIH